SGGQGPFSVRVRSRPTAPPCMALTCEVYVAYPCVRSTSAIAAGCHNVAALVRIALIVLTLWLASVRTTVAQDTGDSLFDHSDSSRFRVSGQLNIVFQEHPAFPALYSGANSLRPEAEHAMSR